MSLFFKFQVMSKLGIPKAYIVITKVLFAKAKIAICLNGQETESFGIGRGVRQGWPLAPFLFVFVEEALHSMSFSAMQRGSLQGIRLPREIGRQLLVQYVDNVSYTFQDCKENMVVLTNLLHTFWLAIGLKMN